MFRNQSETSIRFIPAVYATEEEAAIAHMEARDALEEFVRAIARADHQRHYKELMETGRCRWMSLDPNVDWKKHDAEWAAYDAAKDQVPELNGTVGRTT